MRKIYFMIFLSVLLLPMVGCEPARVEVVDATLTIDPDRTLVDVELYAFFGIDGGYFIIDPEGHGILLDSEGNVYRCLRVTPDSTISGRVSAKAFEDETTVRGTLVFPKLDPDVDHVTLRIENIQHYVMDSSTFRYNYSGSYTASFYFEHLGDGQHGNLNGQKKFAEIETNKFRANKVEVENEQGEVILSTTP